MRTLSLAVSLGLSLYVNVKAAPFYLPAPAAPSRSRLNIPRFPACTQARIAQLRAAGFNFALRRAYDTVDFALQHSPRASPGEIMRRLRDSAPGWMADSLAVAADLDPSSLSDGELSQAISDIDYFNDSLAPFMEPDSLGAAHSRFQAIRVAAESRGLIRQMETADSWARALGHRPDSALRPAQRAALRRFLARRDLIKGADPRPAAPAVPPQIDSPRKTFLGRLSQRFRLASFFLALVMTNQGKAPVFAADMDDTVTASMQPADPAMISKLAELAALDGRFMFISASSLAAIYRQLAGPLALKLAGKPGTLSRFTFGARSGSQIFRYDANSRNLQLVHAHDLEGMLKEAGFPDGLQRIRAIADETAGRFDFAGDAERVIGTRPSRIIVEDWVPFQGKRLLSQISIVPPGAHLPAAQRELYHRSGGPAKRRTYAAFINQRLKEEGIPLEARVGGKTSIDIGPDKGWGLRNLTRLTGADLNRVIWAGDLHEPSGVDRPAAELSRYVIHVGPALRNPPPRPMFHEPSGGPQALLRYFEVSSLYARISLTLRSWWRAVIPRPMEEHRL
ncbi:MAG: hypothetical protein HY549_11470 [Elusimicrobia bacterium]|nr:hypothetical protein [Elusimicrobiota bacterium]